MDGKARPRIRSAAWACLMLAAGAAGAGETAPADTDPIPPADSVQALATASTVTVPPLTVVPLTLLDALSSETSRTGDRFRLAVAADVKIGDAIVIPQGTIGEGEVIHAARSRGGGKAGELILAARYLQVGDATVRLRSLGAVPQAGKDYAFEALATSFVAGPFALFLRGGVIEVPAGTAALAKTLVETRLPAVSPAVVPAETAAAPANSAPTADPSNQSSITTEPQR